MPSSVPYTHTDGRTLFLGKGPARIDPRTFKLEKFLPLAAPPASVNWFGSVTSFGEMLNDQLGDCVVAALGHAKQVVTLNTPGGEITPPDIIIEELYEHACGYVPGNPSTDNGCVIVDTLNYVRHNGLGHKQQPRHHHRPLLYAYADPNPGDFTHLQQGIATFMVADIGLQLPITAQAQIGGLWDVVGDPSTDPDSMPGSWGLHSIILGAYTQSSEIYGGVTWGALQSMTQRFLATYMDECHILLLYEILARLGATSNVNLALLDQELQALNN
jgi:hypothetical protein